MNEEQYRQLCEFCDDLLRAPDSSLPRMAISWLHVLNEHPANLAQYVNLFAHGRVGVMQGVKRVIRSLWGMRPRLSREQPWYGPAVFPDRADVVIVSHLLNKSQLGVAEDFYFGELPEALEARGLMTVVALRDHTGLDLQHLSRSWPATSAPRVIFSRSLGWLDEFKLRKRLWKEAGVLRRVGEKAMPGLQRRVCEAAAAQALTSSSFATLRLYDQVQNLVKRLRPSSIVVTYEGHAWERIVFAAARSVNPSIRCVGYHHAILFPHQHAIKRSLGGEYDPDMICAAGHVTRAVLESFPLLQSLPVVTVGTHRQEEQGSSLIDKLSSEAAPACLVIPDGTMEECLTILDFVLVVAQAAPDINFVVRMHPVMPFASVVARDERLKAMPANVQISDKSINDDFERCRWAIYRGSGAAICAVVAGLRPFYFKPRDERLGIDPLYELQAWRYIVSGSEDFLPRIRLDLASDAEALAFELTKPREFCMAYFTPVSMEEFCRYIVARKSSS